MSALTRRRLCQGHVCVCRCQASRCQALSPLQVNYDEKTGKGKEDASDYSAQSEDSGQESGEEGPFGKPASKVHWLSLRWQSSHVLASSTPKFPLQMLPFLYNDMFASLLIV